VTLDGDAHHRDEDGRGVGGRDGSARPQGRLDARPSSALAFRRGSHLHALRLVRQFRAVRVWSPRHADRFAAQFGVRATSSAEDAVRGADVIVVATMCEDAGGASAPGCRQAQHVNAVGAVAARLARAGRRPRGARAAVRRVARGGPRESGDAMKNGRVSRRSASSSRAPRRPRERRRDHALQVVASPSRTSPRKPRPSKRALAE
jgi:hypothetical protein